jgi:hypothetical protein
MREALARAGTVTIRDLGEDTLVPRHRERALRLANRMLRSLQRRELRSAVIAAVDDFHPDRVVIYKGANIDADLVAAIQGRGCAAVNVFPDCSPHAHGKRLQRAIGAYDLVISTKPFHPRLWQSEYGYRNRCVCVPHGYDPDVHYWPHPATSHRYDVALCATWRPEYHRLMRSFADALRGKAVSAVIAGSGWPERRQDFPGHWTFLPAQSARSYGECVRSARIAIAPVNRDVNIAGVRQHGDEDTSRTYELAAAHCFFVHQRTDFVSTVYDEETEVPLWRDGEELASLVRRWLPDKVNRTLMASRAHARAVPAYSISSRAVEVLWHLRHSAGVLRRAAS